MAETDSAGDDRRVGWQAPAARGAIGGVVIFLLVLIFGWMLLGWGTWDSAELAWPAVVRWAVGLALVVGFARFWLARAAAGQSPPSGTGSAPASRAETLVKSLHSLTELFARSEKIPEHIKTDEERRRWCEVRELEIDLGENFLLVVGFISLWLILGFLGNAFWAWGASSTSAAGSGTFLRLLGSNALASGAAALFGGLLGFIFGIPRTTVVTSSAAGARANTNLEQVSDWLTTLLIGATLTQLVNIPQGLWSIAGALASLVPPPATPPAIVGHQAVLVSTIVYHFIVGFLGLFLVTRVNFTYIFGHDALSDGSSADASASDLERLSVVGGQIRAALASRGEADLDRAIAEAETAARVVHTADINRDFQTLLARAYGRRYQQKLAAKASLEQLADLSGRALAAVTLAIKDADAQSPWRKTLRSHFDGAEPVPPSTEKDLLGFKDDKRFQDLLGLVATPQAVSPPPPAAPIAPLVQTLNDALASSTRQTLQAALDEATRAAESARSEPEVQALLARVQGRLYRIVKENNPADPALEALLQGARDAVGKAAVNPVQKTALLAELPEGKDLGDIAADPTITAALA